jgi:uncharacterized small protein (DUF1192 family)
MRTGADEGKPGGGRAAQADDDRVIDLTLLDAEHDHDQHEQVDSGRSSATEGVPWTIDLTELERSSEREAETEAMASHAAERAQRASPRTARVVGTLAVIAVMVLSTLSVVSYRWGNAWRDIALEQRQRGEALEQQLTAATQAVTEADRMVMRARRARDTAAAAHDAAAGQLGVSEEDVADLEARIAALANEKARLEDEAAVAGEVRQVSARGDAALMRCVTDVEAWLARAPADGAAAAWRLWSGEATAWQGECDAALAASRR